MSASTYVHRDIVPILLESLAIGDLACTETAFSDARDVANWPVEFKINVKNPIKEIKLTTSSSNIKGFTVTYNKVDKNGVKSTESKTHGVKSTDDDTVISFGATDQLVTVSGIWGKYGGSTGLVSITFVKVDTSSATPTVKGPYGYTGKFYEIKSDDLKVFYATGPILAFGGQQEKDSDDHFTLKTVSFVAASAPVDDFEL